MQSLNTSTLRNRLVANSRTLWTILNANMKLLSNMKDANMKLFSILPNFLTHIQGFGTGVAEK